MKSPDNDKWLDDALSDAIGSKRAQADFEQWKQAHPQAVEMLTSRAESRTSATGDPHTIRIKIMKSPITRIAAAAAIIVGLSVGMSQFDFDGSVAWADVARKIENCRGWTCRVVEKRTMRVRDRDVEIKTRALMQVSPEHGMRQQRYQNEQLVVTVYLNLQDNQMVSLLHPMKKYGREPLEKDIAGEFAQMSADNLVRALLSKEHTELGRRTINGVEVQGIEMDYGTTAARLWVSVETQWPILYEIRNAKNAEPHLVMDNYEWDVELETSIFEPNIPSDYTLLEK